MDSKVQNDVKIDGNLSIYKESQLKVLANNFKFILMWQNWKLYIQFERFDNRFKKLLELSLQL
ncbi:unnamed protein product [Paramecium sonneborni]|uniref:Uncharacterized protein n=1 Tax=Paramecium sonneborni TaxID=65129 RepID=A0A8S1RRC2_9CILI|nr:unnamed protein product [Paramecium sonneborni]